MRITLIDGDTLVWAVAYNNKDEDTPDKMYVAIDSMLSLALRNTKADKYCGFIQGRDNSHRHKLFKSYKANRPPRPEWFSKWKPAIEVYLTDPFGKWRFQFVDGVEVDDAVASVSSILAKQEGAVPIICSIDKDLKQIAGEHYNPQKQETTIVTQEQADYLLCRQILMGDAVDGIKGLKGIGIAKATKLLEGVPNDLMSQIVLREYIAANKQLALGLLEFSENTLMVTLKQDPGFEYTLYPANVSGDTAEKETETTSSI